MSKSRPRRGSPLHTAGAFELFGQSYHIIRDNFGVFVVVFAPGLLLSLWETLGRYTKDEPNSGWKAILLNHSLGGNVDSGVFAAGGFMFIFTIIYVIAYLLLLIGVLRTAQGHSISVGGLWKELTANWLWLKVLGGLIVSGAAVVIGLILLIIPGVILLWRLFFVPYVLIDQRTSIEQALKTSWRMTSGHSGAIYGVVLVSILLSLSGIIPIFGALVSFILTSIYMVAPALRYQELKEIYK